MQITSIIILYVIFFFFITQINSTGTYIKCMQWWTCKILHSGKDPLQKGKNDLNYFQYTPSLCRITCCVLSGFVKTEGWNRLVFESRLSETYFNIQTTSANIPVTAIRRNHISVTRDAIHLFTLLHCSKLYDTRYMLVYIMCVWIQFVHF